MRVLSFLAVALLACQVAVAQDAATSTTGDYQDVVLLKNGAEFHGRIVENIEGKKLRIERRDGYVAEIPYSEIFLITTEDMFAEREDEFRASLDSLRGAPLNIEHQNHTRLGFLLGEDEEIFSASTVNGALIDSSYFVGVGLGWDNYEAGNGVPMFAEFLKPLSKGGVVPYFYVTGGYQLLWIDFLDGANHGGITFGAGFGVEFLTGPAGGFVGQMGYRYQEVKWLNDTYNYYGVSLGYSF